MQHAHDKPSKTDNDILHLYEFIHQINRFAFCVFKRSSQQTKKVDNINYTSRILSQHLAIMFSKLCTYCLLDCNFFQKVFEQILVQKDKI